MLALYTKGAAFRRVASGTRCNREYNNEHFLPGRRRIPCVLYAPYFLRRSDYRSRWERPRQVTTIPRRPNRWTRSHARPNSTRLPRAGSTLHKSSKKLMISRVWPTIPADVASVRKGMLPKDVIDKLKQTEKLSKRLRTELIP